MPTCKDCGKDVWIISTALVQTAEESNPYQPPEYSLPVGNGKAMRFHVAKCVECGHSRLGSLLWVTNFVYGFNIGG